VNGFEFMRQLNEANNEDDSLHPKERERISKLSAKLRKEWLDTRTDLDKFKCELFDMMVDGLSKEDAQKLLDEFNKNGERK